MISHHAARLALASLLSLCCLAGPTTVAAAADLIVDNVRGSDLQNDRGLLGTPPTFGPYRTITRALAAAGPGDRIVLTKTDRPYRECISLTGLTHSGTPTEPLTILGNGATLDGSEPAPAEFWQAQPRQPDLWVLLRTPPGFGLLLMPEPALQRVLSTGGPVPLAQLKPLDWTRQNGRIYLRTEPGLGPRNYPLRVTRQTTGITLYDVQHVVIEDLTVRGFRIDGINAADRVTEVLLRNVTTLENGRSGVSVGGASRVVLEGSVSAGNGESQLRTEGRGALALREVVADATSAPAVEQDGGRLIGKPLE
ncbi:right-handed parallel beta-helix repeat-containing protein [Roseimaritima sediminicola]|uniref:right-handed parallel beta-helix repeat-containing protein n=1 Tax=Roseimaritima sediminicola TaxID=2662066 RepID=UPI001298411E|nr:right-handed parallel beta-helix repeat-containing protein [Roseimaritima sediminicola]